MYIYKFWISILDFFPVEIQFCAKVSASNHVHNKLNLENISGQYLGNITNLSLIRFFRTLPAFDSKYVLVTKVYKPIRVIQCLN